MQGWRFKLIKALAFIHKIVGLSDSDFRDYYENKHAPLASSLLSFEGYERNYISAELNPLFTSLGSISIFTYESMASLDIIGKQMSSDAGDTLRDDEVKFMDVSKNYFVLTESNQLTEKEFNKKIFYSANSEDNLNLLDSYEGIEKISNNLIIEPNEIMGIVEYGITKKVSFDTLKNLTQEHPQAMIASCIS
jgi:hypothetical protein